MTSYSSASIFNLAVVHQSLTLSKWRSTIFFRNEVFWFKASPWFIWSTSPSVQACGDFWIFDFLCHFSIFWLFEVTTQEKFQYFDNEGYIVIMSCWSALPCRWMIFTWMPSSLSSFVVRVEISCKFVKFSIPTDIGHGWLTWLDSTWFTKSTRDRLDLHF